MKKILFFTLLISISFLGKSQCNDLFISEYVEGWSNNKAIELFNPTNSPINLANYELRRYSNGSTIASSNKRLPLAGIIGAYQTYVVVINKTDPLGTGQEFPIDTALQTKADTLVDSNYNINNFMYFNGNDGVVLFKTSVSPEKAIDIIGRIGEDPSTFNVASSNSIAYGWPLISVSGDSLAWTKDHTLVRKFAILEGDTNAIDIYDPRLEWDSLPANTFSSLGSHNCNCNCITVYDTISDTTCNATYVGPSGKIYSTSGVYNDTTVLSALCFRYSYLNLTFNVSGGLNDSVYLNGHEMNAGVSGHNYQWYKDCFLGSGWSAIPGATNQTYLPSSFATEFAVVISGSGCTDTSSCIFIDSNNMAKFIIISSTSSGTVLGDSSFGLAGLSYKWYFGDGDSSTQKYPSHTYSSAGNYNVCLEIVDSSNFGSNRFCDSVTIGSSLQLSVQCGLINDTIFDTICPPYIGGSGKYYSVNGVYYDTITNGASCFGITQLNLVFNTPSICNCYYNDTITDSTCNSTYSSFSGKIFTSTGIYYDTLSAPGCDTIFQFDLTFNTGAACPCTDVNITIHDTVCPPNYITPSGNIITTTGFYTDTVPMVSSSCDTVYYLSITFKLPSVCSCTDVYDTITDTICGGVFMSPSGRTYTTSGVYNDTIAITPTCDSFFQINLTVNPSVQLDSVYQYGRTIYSAVNGASYQWLQDCTSPSTISAIPGATNQSYSPRPNNTLYSVEVTKNGCVDTSTCVFVDTNCMAYFVPTQTTPGQVILQDSSFGYGTITYTWYFGDGDSSMLQYPTHTYLSSGSYYVCLRINDPIVGCTNFYCDSITIDTAGILRKSFSLTVIKAGTLGIKKGLELVNFNLFPNPTSDLVNIQLNNKQQNNVIELIDIKGKVIFSVTSIGKEFVTINTQSFANGVYMVRLRNELGQKNMKLIIQ